MTTHVNRPRHPSQRSGYRFPTTIERLERMPLRFDGRPHVINWGLLKHGYPLERLQSSPHFLLLGTTGSGKTTLMCLFMSSILRDSRFPRVPLRYRALVNDPKQTMIPFLHQMGLNINDDVIITNPFDLRSSAWEISADVKSQGEIENFSNVVCPVSPLSEVESSNGGNQAFWNNVANELFFAVIAGLILRSKDGYWDLRDVVCTCRDENAFQEVVQTTDDGKAAWSKYFENSSYELRSSCRATIWNKVRRLTTTAALWSHAEQTFSVKAWRSKGAVILLGYKVSSRKTTQPTNFMLTRAAIHSVVDQPGDDYLANDELSWLFLDEISSIGETPELITAINYGRGKGLRVVISDLSFSNLKISFRNDAEVKAVINGCQNKAILKLISTEDCEMAAQMIGLALKRKQSFNQPMDGSAGSYTVNFQRDYVITPEDIRQLPLAAESGVRAIFLTNENPPVVLTDHGSMSGPEQLAALPRRSGNSSLPPAIIERPAEHQKLTPWKQEDRRRFNLRSKSPDLQSTTKLKLDV